MLSRSLVRSFSSDFAHKQVSSGFSKKYGENFDKIFGKKPQNPAKGHPGEPKPTKSQTEKK
jgi:hypothetical protein